MLHNIRAPDVQHLFDRLAEKYSEKLAKKKLNALCVQAAMVCFEKKQREDERQLRVVARTDVPNNVATTTAPPSGGNAAISDTLGLQAGQATRTLGRSPEAPSSSSSSSSSNPPLVSGQGHQLAEASLVPAAMTATSAPADAARRGAHSVAGASSSAERGPVQGSDHEHDTSSALNLQQSVEVPELFTHGEQRETSVAASAVASAQEQPTFLLPPTRADEDRRGVAAATTQEKIGAASSLSSSSARVIANHQRDFRAVGSAFQPPDAGTSTTSGSVASPRRRSGAVENPQAGGGTTSVNGGRSADEGTDSRAATLCNVTGQQNNPETVQRAFPVPVPDEIGRLIYRFMPDPPVYTKRDKRLQAHEVLGLCVKDKTTSWYPKIKSYKTRTFRDPMQQQNFLWTRRGRVRVGFRFAQLEVDFGPEEGDEPKLFNFRELCCTLAGKTLVSDVDAHWRSYFTVDLQNGVRLRLQGALPFPNMQLEIVFRFPATNDPWLTWQLDDALTLWDPDNFAFNVWETNLAAVLVDPDAWASRFGGSYGDKCPRTGHSSPMVAVERCQLLFRRPCDNQRLYREHERSEDEDADETDEESPSGITQMTQALRSAEIPERHPALDALYALAGEDMSQKGLREEYFERFARDVTSATPGFPKRFGRAKQNPVPEHLELLFPKLGRKKAEHFFRTGDPSGIPATLLSVMDVVEHPLPLRVWIGDRFLSPKITSYWTDPNAIVGKPALIVNFVDPADEESVTRCTAQDLYHVGQDRNTCRIAGVAEKTCLLSMKIAGLVENIEYDTSHCVDLQCGLSVRFAANFSTRYVILQDILKDLDEMKGKVGLGVQLLLRVEKDDPLNFHIDNELDAKDVWKKSTADWVEDMPRHFPCTVEQYQVFFSMETWDPATDPMMQQRVLKKLHAAPVPALSCGATAAFALAWPDVSLSSFTYHRENIFGDFVQDLGTSKSGFPKKFGHAQQNLVPAHIDVLFPKLTRDRAESFFRTGSICSEIPHSLIRALDQVDPTHLDGLSFQLSREVDSEQGNFSWSPDSEFLPEVIRIEECFPRHDYMVRGCDGSLLIAFLKTNWSSEATKCFREGRMGRPLCFLGGKRELSLVQEQNTRFTSEASSSVAGGDNAGSSYSALRLLFATENGDEPALSVTALCGGSNGTALSDVFVYCPPQSCTPVRVALVEAKINSADGVNGNCGKAKQAFTEDGGYERNLKALCRLHKVHPPFLCAGFPLRDEDASYFATASAKEKGRCEKALEFMGVGREFWTEDTTTSGEEKK